MSLPELQSQIDPDDLQDLLVKTSRTFALAIPLIPEPVRRQVGVAYLLFRIADTLEDGVEWSAEQRAEELADFHDCLGLLTASPSDALHPVPWADAVRQLRQSTRRWLEQPPLQHEGYLELLQRSPEVLAELASMPAAAADQIRHHLQISVDGMRRFVEQSEDGVLQLGRLADLEEYCYVVAGVVGEMLTELFLVQQPELGAVAAELRKRSRAFGEGLQLVNILKDSNFDALEGRTYLPRGVGRDTVLKRARRDLKTAREYTRILHEGQAQPGVVAYHALLVLLADGSLDVLDANGPGAKMTRPQVAALLDWVTGCAETRECPL